MAIDNMRPHKPTFIVAAVYVLLIVAVYHFTIGRKKRG